MGRAIFLLDYIIILMTTNRAAIVRHSHKLVNWTGFRQIEIDLNVNSDLGNMYA